MRRGEGGGRRGDLLSVSLRRLLLSPLAFCCGSLPWLVLVVVLSYVACRVLLSLWSFLLPASYSGAPVCVELCAGDQTRPVTIRSTSTARSSSLLLLSNVSR